MGTKKRVFLGMIEEDFEKYKKHTNNATKACGFVINLEEESTYVGDSIYQINDHVSDAVLGRETRKRIAEQYNLPPETIGIYEETITVSLEKIE